MPRWLDSFASPRPLLALLVVPLLLCAAAVGCKPGSSHTSSPQLRQIDELINKQLPPGTPMSQVTFFLSSRGYPSDRGGDPHAINATIEHVDTETLQPSAARVTFHFDANDKLLTYDMTAVTPAGIH